MPKNRFTVEITYLTLKMYKYMKYYYNIKHEFKLDDKKKVM